MTAFRFLHAADLHLGRRFAGFGDDAAGEETRHHLVAARSDQIARLGEAAVRHGAADVVVAGDLFDTETPTPSVVSHALNGMGSAPLRWWIIPGNHDSLAAEALWEMVAEKRPENVRVLATAAPVGIAPGVVLVPAPVTSRYPGRDLTEAMAAIPSPDGALRIGLAHGAVWSFGAEAAVIADGRQDSAGLDYLALGDRHAFTRVASRTYYAGTPERDGFDFDGPGAAAAVTIEAPGAEPVVESVVTGRFDWRTAELDLLPGMDAAAALADLLPRTAGSRADGLVRVLARGRLGHSERARLAAAADRVRPDYRHFTLDTDRLETEHAAGDIDEIAPAGALRAAAEALREAALSGPEAERPVAAAALDRLFGLARDAGR